VILRGGDKRNGWEWWYRDHIPVADRLNDEHLAALVSEGGTT